MSADNTLILIGRLTADPKVTYSQGDKPLAIATFSMAVDRHDKNKTTDFINCKAIGNRGEFAEKYLKKGTKVVLKGYWETGNYTNKDGVKVYTNNAFAEDLSFAESKGASASNDAPTVGNSSNDLPLPNNDVSNGFKPVSSDLPPFLNVTGDENLPFAPVTR